MSEIDEVLAGYNFNADEAWPLYKEKFLRRSALDRDAELKAFDAFAEDRMSAPSRETADLLVRKRELLDMHSMLRKLGR
jgi:hypothetical protein